MNTNMDHLHEFYKKVKYRKLLFFKLELSNLVANWQYEDYEIHIILNFCSISLKLCLVGQNNTGKWDASTVIT